MKVFVKTLKGTHFHVEVNPNDTVVSVKKNIETVQGADVYPASQQMLIHQGQRKSSSGEGSAAAQTVGTPTSKAPSTTASSASFPGSATPQNPASSAPIPTSVPVSAPTPVILDSVSQANVSGENASSLPIGSNLEPMIQQILDMGGGTWDRDTVICALRAAYNNPERAVEYLYSGIPDQAEVPPISQSAGVGVGQPVNASSVPQQPTQAPMPSSGPNANPLNLFPQGLPNVGSGAATAGVLDFLRNSEQFQALRAMVQSNPQILQPMLQELGKQNPELIRLIQEHQAEFLQLMNEPVEGEEGNILEQLGDVMPEAIEVTPEEHEAIERLEAMGFNRDTVLEVFIACNKNEELAANYLLDHINDFEE